jgi:hypothetical protein
MNFRHEVLVTDREVPHIVYTKKLELKNDKLYVHLNMIDDTVVWDDSMFIYMLKHLLRMYGFDSTLGSRWAPKSFHDECDDYVAVFKVPEAFINEWNKMFCTNDEYEDSSNDDEVFS